MRRRYLLTFFLLIAVNVIATDVSAAGNIEKALKGISKAMNNGSYSELSESFSSTIDMTIPGNEGNYSKNQAEMIMKDFFSKYPVKSFSVKNKSDEKEKSCYVIGELKTDREVFRTFFMLKEISGKYLIQQLKIEK